MSVKSASYMVRGPFLHWGVAHNLVWVGVEVVRVRCGHTPKPREQAGGAKGDRTEGEPGGGHSWRKQGY